MKKLLLSFITFALCLYFNLQNTHAQISVTVTNNTNTTPALATSYISLAAAITDLNAVTAMSGTVIFNLAANGTETAPVGGYQLGASLLNAATSVINTITFQKSGTGSNPIINAYTGGTGTPSAAVQDGIWSFNGIDYVTIDGIDLYDPNTTNPETMEYGYGLFKAGTSDGCRYNTIRNCVITLNRDNFATGTAPSLDGSRAINMVNALYATQTTAIIPASAAGTNSYNQFYSNTLQNCNIGIAIVGYAGPSPFTLCDHGNDIGGSSLLTGNSIINYGGGTLASNPAAGIHVNYQWDINISYNTVNNNNGSGLNHPNTLRGVYAQSGTSANISISYNNITIHGGGTSSSVYGIDNGIGTTPSGNTVNIDNNTITGTYTTATTGTFYAINNTASPTTVNINYNTISGISTPGTGAIHCTFNNSATSATALNENYNDISSVTKTGDGQIDAFYVMGAPTVSVQHNTVDGLSCTAASSTSTIYAYNNGSNSAIESISNNIFRNFSSTGIATIRGIFVFTANGNKTFQNNSIYNFTSTGGGTLHGIYMGYGAADEISNNQVYGFHTTGGPAGANYGIYVAAGITNNIFKNKIYDLSNSSTGPVVYGIYINGGTTNNIYNNLIGDLRTPAANTAIPLAGIYILAGTSTNVYYNTVYLNATSSGATFGSTAIYVSAAPTLDLRNNILVNTSSRNGATGYTSAYRRATTSLTRYASTSDNNLFYAGTPGTYNLIMYDGTNSYQTLSAYKAAVSPRDAASISENPTWLSTTGSNSGFLHINTAITTDIESGAANISALTDDFDGDVRQGNPGYPVQLNGYGTAPDIGADEFDGMRLILCSGTPAIATINGVTGVCINTGTTLSLSNSYTDVGISYQWGYSTVSGGPYTNLGTSPTQATGNLTVTTYFICTITCSFSELSYTTAEKSVVVHPLPTVIVTPSSGSYCLPGGSGVPLSASGASTYAWNPSTGLNVTTGANVNAYPAVNTTYTATGTDVYGCVNTANSSITVNYGVSLYSITATPSFICYYDSTELSVLGGTTEDYILSSTPFGMITPSGSTTSLGTGDDVLLASAVLPFNFSFYGANYSTLYIFSNGFVSFSSGQPASAPFVQAIPDTAKPQNYIALSHDDLNVTIPGAVKYFTNGTVPNRIFVVDYDGVKYFDDGANDGNLTGQIQLFEADGHIEIHIQNSVDPAPSPKTIGIENSSGTAGYAPITRNDSIYDITTPEAWKFFPNGGELTYLWSESPLSGTIVDANINPAKAKNVTSGNNYMVTITDPSGCSNTGTVHLNVGLQLIASASASPSTTICSGSPVTLTATPGGGGAPYSYSWKVGNTVVSTSQSFTAYPVSTTTYIVTITDNCPHTSTASVTITTKPVPTSVPSSNSPVCSGSTLYLSGTSNIGTSFYWTGPNNYTSTEQYPRIYFAPTAASGTYSLTAAFNGCTSPIGTVTVIINETPSAVTVSPPTPSVCPGGIQELIAEGGISAHTILSENFNGGTNSWIKINNSSGGSYPALAAWTLQPDGYYYSSTPFHSNDNSQFYLTNSDTCGVGVTAATILQSPSFSTLNYSAVKIKFYHYLRYLSGTATVEVSNDSTNWTILQTYTMTQGDFASFTLDSVSLPAPFLNHAAVYMRYKYDAGWDYYWAIDNVLINGTQNGPFTWSPTTELYTNAGGTIPYTGTQSPSVYSKPTTGHTYTITASAFGCSNAGNVSININPLPGEAGTISGNSSVCQGQGGEYSVAPISNATSYTWSYSGTGASISGSTNPMSINFSSTSTSGNLTVMGTNVCGNGTVSAIYPITINPLPGAAGTITGSATVCQGESGVSFSVQAISNASNYIWAFSGTGASISGSTNSVTISFSTSATSGNLTVVGTNTCGNGMVSVNFPITVNPLPAVADAITGSAFVCQGESNVQYSVPAILNASSYIWAYSGSGASISGSTNQISINFSSSATSGILTVKGNNACGNGTVSANYPITVNPLPGNAGTISGTSVVCQEANGVSFSLPAISDASSYTWFYSGTGVNISGFTNPIYIDFSSSATSGDLTVIGTNACGNGTVSANYPITVNPLPGTVGAITGTTTQYPGLTGQIYSIGSVAYATTYTWTIPAGWTITAGQGTTSLTVTTGSVGQNGNIGVTAGNNCGTSAQQTLAVTVIPATKTLNLTSVMLEGLYIGSGAMRQAWDELGPHWPAGVADHITVELHNSSNYDIIAYTASNVPLSTSGNATITIPANYNSSYYITVKHRNSLETSSSSAISFTGTLISQSFGSAANVYGGNMGISNDGHHFIYGGDINQDGYIDTQDYIYVDNDSYNFLSGYLNSDVDGNGMVDTNDYITIDNNNYNFISSVLP